MSCENCANAYDEGYTAGHNAENARLRVLVDEYRGECVSQTFENARLREQADALADALRNQGLLQNSPNGVIWHVHDCPASFDFSECHYRCRVAREAFALAGTEPYVSQETRRDTEVYE